MDFLDQTTTTHLALVVGLTLDGHHFIKGDLNRLSARDCQVIRSAGTGLLVIPYRRVAALIERQCPVANRVLVLPSVRMRPSRQKQLSKLAEALPATERALLLTVNVTSSLTRSQNRAEAFMARRCERVRKQGFGDLPNAWLRPDRPPGYRRYTLQTFSCPGS